MPNVCCTVLEARRPDLLRRTLGASKDVLGQCLTVRGFVWDQEDAESQHIMRGACSDVTIGSGEANGPATSECARLFLESGCDLWLHLEGDWKLSADRGDIGNGWLEAACDIASNPAIGQVRLREVEHLGKPVPIQEGDELLFAFDGSGASNRNWCNDQLVKWRTNEGWPFMVGPAHFTQNPFIMHRRFAEQVYFAPTLNERHAMDRFYAARTERGERPLVAQMRPGVYQHIGEGRHVGKH